MADFGRLDRRKPERTESPLLGGRLVRLFGHPDHRFEWSQATGTGGTQRSTDSGRTKAPGPMHPPCGSRESVQRSSYRTVARCSYLSSSGGRAWVDTVLVRVVVLGGDHLSKPATAREGDKSGVAGRRHGGDGRRASDGGWFAAYYASTEIRTGAVHGALATLLGGLVLAFVLILASTTPGRAESSARLFDFS